MARLRGGQSCYLMPRSDEGKPRIAGKSPKMRHTKSLKPSSAPPPRPLKLDHHVGNDHAEGGAAFVTEEHDLAAMGVDQLGGDGEPKACAAFARHALKRLEEMSPRPLRHPGAGIAHVDQGDGALAPRGDHDLAHAVGLALQRLHSVAAEIA